MAEVNFRWSFSTLLVLLCTKILEKYINRGWEEGNDNLKAKVKAIIKQYIFVKSNHKIIYICQTLLS